ncbi:DUF3080 domain-containing protein [Photobacterium minamisatsumaniensis]|uniref:DUF3080 domain-containing protein n=1 Tax=Photobacterium minamisatsumaniensis TaxID=2910233 RepID=UPI003D1251C4
MSGCDQSSSTANFSNYSQRLASVLDTQPAAPNKIEYIEFPSTRSLTLPIDDIRIGLLDAYELRTCGLFHLIAERNSVLGKVQDQSRQLRYELLLLNGLSHCLSTIDENNELSGILLEFEQKKKKQLPFYLWNMMTTGQEWRQQFRLHHQPFSLNEFYGFNEAIDAFTYLRHLSEAINQQSSISNSQAERILFHQEKIHPHHYLGQLFFSMATATEWLSSITLMLEKNESSIICGANRNQQTVQYLSNVFYKYFATNIQGYLAELDSQYRQIQPIVEPLLSAQLEINDSLSSYYNFYIAGQLHQSFREATLRHVTFWQRTFKRCNIKVGLN